jgi:quercetin dioxygenase-like cupin family protein
MQSKEFLLQSEMTFQTADTGMKRQIMGYNNDIMMVRVLFEKGAVGVQHKHPHIQTTYVVSGKFEVTIDGKIQILNAGEGFFVPSEILHGAVCLEAGELIDVFAPMREDFLK